MRERGFAFFLSWTRWFFAALGMGILCQGSDMALWQALGEDVSNPFSTAWSALPSSSPRGISWAAWAALGAGMLGFLGLAFNAINMDLFLRSVQGPNRREARLPLGLRWIRGLLAALPVLGPLWIPVWRRWMESSRCERWLLPRPLLQLERKRSTGIGIRWVLSSLTPLGLGTARISYRVILDLVLIALLVGGSIVMNWTFTDVPLLVGLAAAIHLVAFLVAWLGLRGTLMDRQIEALAPLLAAPWLIPLPAFWILGLFPLIFLLSGDQERVLTRARTEPSLRHKPVGKVQRNRLSLLRLKVLLLPLEAAALVDLTQRWFPRPLAMGVLLVLIGGSVGLLLFGFAQRRKGRSVSIPLLLTAVLGVILGARLGYAFASDNLPLAAESVFLLSFPVVLLSAIAQLRGKSLIDSLLPSEAPEGIAVFLIFGGMVVGALESSGENLWLQMVMEPLIRMFWLSSVVLGAALQDSLLAPYRWLQAWKGEIPTPNPPSLRYTVLLLGWLAILPLGGLSAPFWRQLRSSLPIRVP
jgi:hypothetical protein